MDRKVYIVRVSEDGNLGVYSNIKKAYAEAVRYKESDEEPIKSYSKVCKEFKEHDNFWSWTVDIVDEDKLDGYDFYGNASITLFYLNKNSHGN